MSREIKTSFGHSALVDDDDFERVGGFIWTVMPKGNTMYAVRSQKINGKWQHVYMHHLILPIEKGQEVDHINGNGLDNRKENLRICDKRTNQQNRRKTRGTSRYKGVSWRPDANLWRATIRGDFKQISLGYYRTEEEAARAYDNAARKIFGEFAKTNFSD